MTDRRARWLVWGIALVAALRVLLFAAVDQRPHYGNWESPDLQRAMHYHYGLRGSLDWTFLEQVGRDGFKPPLWYGGVPALFAWKPSLSAFDFLVPNALAAGLLVVLASALGRRVGGTAGGVVAATLAAALPGIAWRVTMVGVEPSHAVLLAASCLALVRLREEPERALRWGTALGLLLGAGALMKWNFPAYVVLPAAVALPGPSWRRVGLGLGVAAAWSLALFVPWATFADLGEVLRQGADEVSHDRGAAWLASASLAGLGRIGTLLALGAAVAAVLRRRDPAPPAPGRTAPILLAGVLGLLLVHLLIPHKESRYLVPAYPLAAAAVAGVVHLVRGRRLLVLGGALGLLAAESLVLPLAQTSSARFSLEELPRPIPHDYGLDALVTHPSLRARERTVVTTSVGPVAYFPVLTLLSWELYGRNPNPVLTRSDWPDVTSGPCAFDLQRSTHFLSNRELSMHEELALRSMGFERVVTVAPDVPDLGDVTLWALVEGEEPRYR